MRDVLQYALNKDTLSNNISYALKNPIIVSRFFFHQLFKYDSIRQLTGASRKEIDGYLSEMESNFRLSYVVRSPFGIGMPESGLIYIIVRALRPDVVLETGVGYGRSSLFILQALEDNKNGILYSVDIQKQRWIVPHELRQKWHFIQGRSSSVLSPLGKLGAIDIFLHDSEHTYENMLMEYKIAWPFIRNGGILASHDILYNTAFSDFCDSIGCKSVCITSNLGAIRKLGKIEAMDTEKI